MGNHYLSGHPLAGPYPVGLQRAYFAMGCFWGAERLFWQQDGVWLTAVGYQGGYTPNPHYEEVCSGMTGHAESVLVVYDPDRIGYRQLLQLVITSYSIHYTKLYEQTDRGAESNRQS